jgi:hypothetical protein
MRKFGMFFRAIHHESGGSRYPTGRPVFPESDTQDVDARNQDDVRRQTVSKRSMRSVSARPSRVHSWNAGNACIASK